MSHVRCTAELQAGKCTGGGGDPCGRRETSKSWAGTGISTTESATQWDENDIITGQFQGTGFNDVLDYDPTTGGTAGCSGNLLNTYGQRGR